MNSQVCVNCHNNKPVNLTDNRLVTESCGHVKCMDCLLQEKSGCLACIKEKAQLKLEDSIEVEVEPIVENGILSDTSPASGDESGEVMKNGDNLVAVVEDLSKKKKPETSHIRIEIDGRGARSFVCTLCKKRFHARSQVVYHAYCNGQRKPHQCPECNKSFAAHSHYKYHMRVHRNERTFPCEVCGDSFLLMSKLQRHMLTHTKERKYACTECNKSFNNLTALRNHALMHTEERPFLCDKCSRRFRDKSNYNKHVFRHNRRRVDLEPRPFPCPRCPQAFHSKKDMRRHAQVHTDSKPFRCKVCNRRFRRKDNLERHIRNTHPDSTLSSAIECDENALKQITSNEHTPEPNKKVPQKDYENNEKIKLEILNPLPPLPQEVIQKHMHTKAEKQDEPVIDKSYILEANIARQSVIVSKCAERKVPSPVPEYVHKIRKANSMTNQKGVPLPPIDMKKLEELEKKTNLNNLDDEDPKPMNIHIYKNILFGVMEKGRNGAKEEEAKVQSSAGPEMHWKMKMKLNINW